MNAGLLVLGLSPGAFLLSFLKQNVELYQSGMGCFWGITDLTSQQPHEHLRSRPGKSETSRW
jgi:hypothetical protein